MAFMRSIPMVDSNLFSWDKESRMLVGEISTLQANGQGNLYGQIYDDACDVGFQIRSRRTDETVVFYLADEVRTEEQDDQVWIFLPVAECIRKNPKLAEVSVHVLND